MYQQGVPINSGCRAVTSASLCHRLWLPRTRHFAEQDDAFGTAGKPEDVALAEHLGRRDGMQRLQGASVCAHAKGLTTSLRCLVGHSSEPVLT